MLPPPIQLRFTCSCIERTCDGSHVLHQGTQLLRLQPGERFLKPAAACRQSPLVQVHLRGMLNHCTAELTQSSQDQLLLACLP